MALGIQLWRTVRNHRKGKKTVPGETRRMEQIQKEAEERPRGVSTLEALARGFLAPRRSSSALPSWRSLCSCLGNNYIKTPSLLAVENSLDFSPTAGWPPCPGHKPDKPTQQLCSLPSTFMRLSPIASHNSLFDWNQFHWISILL